MNTKGYIQLVTDLHIPLHALKFVCITYVYKKCRDGGFVATSEVFLFL